MQNHILPLVCIFLVLTQRPGFRKKNPSYVHCTFIICKTFSVKCCQSNLINRENALMYSETWKPPIISPTCCFLTFSALSRLAVTALFLVSLTSVFISLICFLVYLAWLKRGKKTFTIQVKLPFSLSSVGLEAWNRSSRRSV